jgi:predicted permease
MTHDTDPHRASMIARLAADARQDIRYALRGLITHRGFTAVAVFTLAIGIAANTTMFSAINAVLLHPVGAKDPDRLVAIRVSYERPSLKDISVSPTNFADIRDNNAVFAAAGMATETGVSYIRDGLPEQLRAQQVTWQWFDVFGARPLLGRMFRPDDDLPNAPRVVVLEYRTWRRLFGGDPSIVGRTIQLDREAHAVVGVMGAAFRRPGVNVWIPLGLPESAYGARNRFNESYEAVALLRPGVSLTQARAAVDLATEQVRHDPRTGRYATTSGWRMSAMPYVTFVVGDLRGPMLILMGAAVFVLLIACANTAGLTVAKASARSNELAVRAALGASRGRLARLILTEGLVLGTVAALVGGILAFGGIEVVTALAPAQIADGLNLRLDTPVMIFTTLIGMASGLLFALVPAWRVGAGTVQTLRETGRTQTATRAKVAARSFLVIAEIGLALVLLVGASLFLRSLSRLQDVKTGFDPRGLITGTVELSPSYTTAERRAAFFSAVLERARQIPSVTMAAAATPLPFSGQAAGSFHIEGRPADGAEPAPHGGIRWASPDYFATLGIPLKEGRAFTPFDTIGGNPVAIIDETLARRYWPNESPIGKRLRRTTSRSPWMTIVGVVGHVKDTHLAAENLMGAYYLPLLQQPLSEAGLVIKTSVEPATVATAFLRAVAAVDPLQPLAQVKTMEERVSATLGPRRFAVILLTFFAGTALFLAALGMYGLISYNVGQRTNEIGVRMALGSNARDVLFMVIRETLVLAVAGVVLGLLGAVLLTRTITGMLYGITPTDTFSFVTATACLLIVATLASYLPARRASRIDPIVALRCQ